MLTKTVKERNRKINHKAELVLAGDVGASKTNLALISWNDGNLQIIEDRKFQSPEYGGLPELIDQFLKELPFPDRISLGVAGPVLEGKAKLSNIGWEIDKERLSGKYRDRPVHLINDLEATAYGLTLLGPDDYIWLHETEGLQGNAAVIAPGTGLGEAGLYWDGSSFHPFATEGGHADFAARDERDFELYLYLQKEFGHVSWERLISGPGIMNIFRFLRDVRKEDVPSGLEQAMRAGDPAAAISLHAGDCRICAETMKLFVRYLAFESANLVLKLYATGGLYIAGGIVPKIANLILKNSFYSLFCQSGRLNYLLEKVPVRLVLNTKTALWGAAWYARKN